MGRRVDPERLEHALVHVLERSGGVRTLNRLVERVNEALAEDDPQYRVSPERLRRVAATHPRLRVQIHTRRAETRRLRPDCPVCGHGLERVENQTLSGSRVVLEARCTACPYWTGRARRVPVRYAFHMRGPE